jgi:hypothetical protein
MSDETTYYTSGKAAGKTGRGEVICSWLAESRNWTASVRTVVIDYRVLSRLERCGISLACRRFLGRRLNGTQIRSMFMVRSEVCLRSTVETVQKSCHSGLISGVTSSVADARTSVEYGV